MQQLIDDDKRYLFQNYGRQPIVIERGEGTRCWDSDGKEYLDFVGGLAVNVLGHAHPAVQKAVAKQAGTLIHTSNLYHTKPMVELAQILVEQSGLDKVMFVNTGTEAVEAAIKLARRWAYDTREGAYEIITMHGGFHGRTMGALAATANERYQEPFQPMLQGFTYVPWDDIASLKAATTARTIAVMLEPIQGEGGVNMPSPGYLKAVQDWCREKGLLFIVDEIQTGNGRTGKLFAYQHDDLQPDIVCVAKGLAGGVPIGAILAKDWLASHIVPGDHGTTFGANPLATAAGVATMRHILDNDLPSQAAQRADYLVNKLRSLEDRLPAVTGVRGKGLLLAIGLSSDIAPDVVAACRERGLLVNNVRPNAVRLMPPLTVSEEELDRACQVLEEAINAVAGS